jgi:hypothetical protein
MRTVEIARSGEASVTEQLDEMRDWLRAEGIAARELKPAAIRQGRAHFRARFERDEEAERFCRQFDEAAHAAP